MNIVIGSGPAGVSCAKALLDHGKKVVLLDGGLTLEPEKATAAASLALLPAGQWPKKIRDYLKGCFTTTKPAACKCAANTSEVKLLRHPPTVGR